jgi:hypothetical protein
MDIFHSRHATATPTISSGVAYTAADQLGGLQTLSDAARYSGDRKGSLLLDIIIVDKDKQNSAMDILFFSDSPTVASSDNAAADVSFAEMSSKFIGRVSIESTDWKSIANCSEATARNVGLHLRPGTVNDPATKLYALAVARGTPTYTSTTSLVFKYQLLQD